MTDKPEKIIQPGVIEQETEEPAIDDEQEQRRSASSATPAPEVPPGQRTMINLQQRDRQIT